MVAAVCVSRSFIQDATNSSNAQWWIMVTKFTSKEQCRLAHFAKAEIAKVLYKTQMHKIYQKLIIILYLLKMLACL